jgi:hypothetical protein
VFTIAAHPRRKLLRVALQGFFTVEQVAWFARSAQEAVAGMGCRSGDWVHICDISDMKVQSQEVAEAFTRFINHPERRSRKLAIVTGQSPVRMQIKRVLACSDAGVFKTVMEAERWISESETMEYRMRA